MALDYQVTPLPAVWPGKATPSYSRKRSPFKANWTRALSLMEREVKYLGGKRVVFAVDVEPRHLRQDGQLRSDARPRSPAVIVSFHVEAELWLFPADAFGFWQDNIDAVGRALEKLRAIDRYGVQQGKQYEGYKQLPASTSATPALNVATAALFCAKHSNYSDGKIVADRDAAREATRATKRRTHPDNGGTHDLFVIAGEAERVLRVHHGGSL